MSITGISKDEKEIISKKKQMYFSDELKQKYRSV